MPEAFVEVGGLDDPLVVRIGGHDPNFRLDTDRISAQAIAPINPQRLDLLDVAAVVFFADSSIRRGGDTRAEMGRDWRRKFDFTIPVRNPDLWGSPAVVAALTKAVSFLTEDHVTFRFEDREPDHITQGFLDFDPDGAAFRADEVILFSGGLDSFAGALEMLATTSGNVILLSHRSAQKVMPRQDALSRYLAERLPGRVQHVKVNATRIGRQGMETTQRSRSLLFAALGEVVAGTFGAQRITFYENGIVSQNLPISPQVVGTMATRTTHPLGLRWLNRVTQMVLDRPVGIRNAYEWMTKTEVVERLKRFSAEEQLRASVSCTTVRDQTKLHPHCGRCSQCLDRRFAVLAAELQEHDPADAYNTDVLFGARRDDRSRTMAIDWTRHAVLLGDLDDKGFMARFGLELTRLMAGFPDLPKSDVLRRIVELHRRHSSAVRGVLSRAVQAEAAEIAAHRIDPTSLLALHIGQSRRDASAMSRDPRAERPAPRLDNVAVSEDLVTSPDAPLVVAFFEENGRHVVAAEGLGRVEGAPARVAHALKPQFDADRAEARTADAHRFVHLTRCTDLENMNEDSIRKNVSRCRKQLADFHTAVHGDPPSRHLLIENRPRHGHRLEPELKLTRPDRLR